MKKTLKQLLCLLLVITMTVTCLPVSALAEEAETTEAETTATETTETETTENETESVPFQGDVISFGSYPQSEVTDETLIATLTENAGSTDNWTSYNYYIGGVQSDYMKYTDIELDGEKYRGVYFTSYRPYYATGSTQTFQDDHGYNVYTIYWFKYEPILWQILSYDAATDTAVVLSKSVIDSQEYYGGKSTRTINGETVYANNYEYSDIRIWLNEAFYNAAFNSDEKAAIEATVLDNSAYSDTYSGQKAESQILYVLLHRL